MVHGMSNMHCFGAIRRGNSEAKLNKTNSYVMLYFGTLPADTVNNGPRVAVYFI